VAAAPEEYAAVQAAMLLENPSPEANAQFLARAQRGAMAYSVALPRGGAASLRGEELIFTIRRQLRLPIPGLEPLGEKPRRCPCCASADVDIFGDHADSCKGMHGLHMKAHDLVRDAVQAVARLAGVREARSEPTRLIEGTHERPADVLLPSYLQLGSAAQRGMECCLDVVRVNSLAPSYIGQRPLQRPVEAAVREKDRRTGLPPHYFPYGFGFSSLGFFHEERVGALLSALAAHRQVAGGASGGQEVPEGAGEALAEQQWLPMLSVAAHRGTYFRIRALLRASSGSGVQPLSDIQFRHDGTAVHHSRRRRSVVGAAGSAALSTDRDQG